MSEYLDEDFQIIAEASLINCHNSIIINQSIKAKPSFLHLNISNMKIDKLPILPPQLQKLIASNNFLQQIPTYLIALKYLDMSNNQISLIPQEISLQQSLEILKLKNNKIQKLHVSNRLIDIQIHYNPIKVIPIEILNCDLITFSCDWITYLTKQHTFWLEGQRLTNFLKRFQLALKSQNIIEMNLRVFLKYFCEIRQMQDPNRIIDLLYIGITHDQPQIFELIEKNYVKLLRIEQLEFKNRLLFEHALRLKSVQVLQKFKHCQFDKNSKYLYLHICCRYSNYQFFRLLVQKGHQINEKDSKDNSILHQLFRNFNQKDSPKIFIEILQSIDNPNHKNVKRVNPLMYSVNHNINAALQLFQYLFDHPQIAKNFDLNDINGVGHQQTILHAVSRLYNLQLLFYFLQLEKVNPFIKNSDNIIAKQQKLSFLTRKVLTKAEKKFIKDHLQNAQKIEQIQQIYKPEINIFSIEVLLLQLLKNYTFTQKISLISSYIDHVIWIQIKTSQNNNQLIKSLITLFKNLSNNQFMLKSFLFIYLGRYFNKLEREVISNQIQSLYKKQLINEDVSNIQSYQKFQTACYDKQFTYSKRQYTKKASSDRFICAICTEVVTKEVAIEVEPRIMSLRPKKKVLIKL